MIRKKSSFLTFCFSFLPGAGQMYMGFMKRGISLMSAFFLLIFFSSWLELSPLLFAAAIVWFYAFFDTFNLRNLPDDEFYATEDAYLKVPGLSKELSDKLQTKYRMVVAVLLILIGVSILWNNFIDILSRILPDEAYSVIHEFGHLFPQLLIACGIIALGVYLIVGKKKELDAIDKSYQIEDKGGFNK